MTYKARITFILMTLFSAIFNLTLPLHPDEAYYWVWSRNLQLSYFDHPPMVAYLIKVFTLVSENVFFIRLVAVACIAISAYLIYKLAVDMFGNKVAEKSLILFLLMPLTQAGLIVVTPDSPLVLFWTLTIYLFYKYISTERAVYMYGTGLAAGMLLLSKYTGVLLFAALFLFIIISTKRKILLRKETYLSLFIAFICLLPVIIWNYQHDWISFKFQFSHGVAAKKVFQGSLLGEFIAGQIIVFNPIFFVGMIYLLLRNLKVVCNEKILYLFCPFALPLIFFMYQAAFKSSEANWPAPAYITGVIILAYLIEKVKAKHLYIAGIVLALILFVVIRIPDIIPGYPSSAVLKRDFMGYPQIMEQASPYLKDNQIVLSDSYQHASEAWYYLKGRPGVYIITPARYSNYNLWSEEVKENIQKDLIKHALFIGSNHAQTHLKDYFASVQLLKTIEYDGPYIQRKFYVYQCDN